MQAHDPATRPAATPLIPANVLFLVFAPFGTDDVLTTFPDGTNHDPLRHPLTQRLRTIAGLGVTVGAVLDMAGGDTWLIQARAGDPAGPQATSLGKVRMDSPTALSSFVQRLTHTYPDKHVVLAMEGHGAGFLPDLDRRLLVLPVTADEGRYEWHLGAVSNVFQATGDDQGKPVVATGGPVLPIGNPTCPSNHDVLTTWGMGAALQQVRDSLRQPVSVIHFNNCFNMSVELLHTISPYAEVATGYCNYNFFTAGEAYPLVFQRLAKQGSATPEELGRWFAEANRQVLKDNGHEPTVGSTIQLSRLRDIVERVDDLADALLAALRTVSANERPFVVGRIQAAIVRAQQYDSRPDLKLEVPDELTDLRSLALELAKEDFGAFKVKPAALALAAALEGVCVYADSGSPWMDPQEQWLFDQKQLAMNIFLPDPLRKGLWDWRSQYYLDVNPDPQKPQVQPHIIDFVKVTDWVDFLVEYHRDTPFVGLLPAAIPEFPVKSTRGDPAPCTRHGRGWPHEVRRR